MFIQGSFGRLIELVYMRSWMIAQLPWDPTLDDRALMKEFLDGYYGPAGRYIQQYIDLLDKVIHRDSSIQLAAYSETTKDWLKLEDLNSATELFNKAAAAVADDEILSKRVRVARYSIEIVWLLRYHEFKQEAKAKGLAFLGPEDPRALTKHLESIQNEIGQYKEWREFPELVVKLKKLF